MKNKKLPKNLGTIFLSVVIISMLVIIILQNHRLHYKNSEEENKITSKSSSNSVPVSKDKHLQYEKAITLLESQSKEIQSSKKVIGNKKEIVSPQKPVKKYPLKIISRENLEGNAKAERKNYKFYYVPFLEKLGVSPGNINELTELYSNRLAEKEKIYHKYYDIYGEELDQSIYLELNDELFFFNESYDEKIQDLVGEDNCERYDLFDKSIVNREMILGFNNQLKSGGKLNEDKSEEFILSLYDIDTDYFPENSKYNSDIAGKPYSYLEFRKLKAKQYLIEAKRILSDSQYKKFVDFLSVRYGGMDSFFSSRNN